ncbi:AraC family transcriptional regulator [Nonomuraea jiangxiensis]|uniref:AraC-type DNA-binding protein n=1 Tax=Nonomuraea jiangxiensis TaxID=633440 RepID=A0A1G9MKX3_9ACTN|nr:AraC family transcriptional regulator [Nonomuraea jiangxiensis]SDL74774.1 AraC-type DNA-binding protein [Nonomuraea jiangxiensis]
MARGVHQNGENVHDRGVVRPAGLRAGFHAHLAGSGVPGLVHAGDQRAPSSWFIAEHRHEVWELYLQTDGPPTRWRVGDAEYEVPPYGLLIVSPHVGHRMARPADTVWQFMFAALDAPLLLPEAPWRRSPAFVADAASAVTPFETFLREVTTTRTLRVPGLRASAQQLLVEVARLLAPSSTAGRLLLHPAVAHVLNVLETRYAERLPLSALAGEAGLSPSYLAALFTAQLGVSPARHQARLRIRRARTLLAETDRSVTWIAAELGFSSPQHFATAFRSHTGATPREFRAAGRR